VNGVNGNGCAVLQKVQFCAQVLEEGLRKYEQLVHEIGGTGTDVNHFHTAYVK